MTDYERLYQAVKEQEDTNECPLFFECGAWFNTSDGFIDMETPKNATVTNDFDEIQELLNECGFSMIFRDNEPVIIKGV